MKCVDPDGGQTSQSKPFQNLKIIRLQTGDAYGQSSDWDKDAEFSLHQSRMSLDYNLKLTCQDSLGIKTISLRKVLPILTKCLILIFPGLHVMYRYALK